MLTTLQIKDYALIENITVEFGHGLNIITGETGAGKSILIDALGLLLGERASTQIIRKDAKKSVVEGIFDVKNNKKIEKLLLENEIDYYDELIVRREVSLKGSNRCFLNDTPVSLALIKIAGNLLVDLHGQHEHQSLLRANTHIEVLDEFGDMTSLLEEYKEEHSKLSEIGKELYLLKGKEKTVKEEREALEFQIKEIDNIAPIEGEEEDLKNELNILENSERLLELSHSVYAIGYEGDYSVNDNWGRICHMLEDLAQIDNSFKEIAGEADSAQAIIEDVIEFVRSYKEKINLESGRLDEIRERLGALNLLKKRYGGSIEKTLEYRKKIGEEFELIENYDEKITTLEKSLNEIRIACGEIAFKLSTRRKVIAEKVKVDVEDALKYLGIPDSSFKVEIKNTQANESTQNFIIVEGQKYKFNSRGYDEIEFLISTNLGEDEKPLLKIASGGEISRIMLALKTILAKTDKLPMLIFDEIDTGVSGRIAQKVGNTMKSLSEYHQILAITHLPQIAGLADRHYAVEKRQLGTRIVSSIRPLPEDDRIKEVAKLLSGEEVTEASLQSAKELIAGK